MFHSKRQGESARKGEPRASILRAQRAAVAAAEAAALLGSLQTVCAALTAAWPQGWNSRGRGGGSPWLPRRVPSTSPFTATAPAGCQRCGPMSSRLTRKH